MILLKIEYVKDISMPWLQVNGKCSWSLPSSLINVVRCNIKYTKHWYESIGYAPGTFDERPPSSYLVYTETDTPSSLSEEANDE
jgi:hypothetical protein